MSDRPLPRCYATSGSYLAEFLAARASGAPASTLKRLAILAQAESADRRARLDQQRQRDDLDAAAKASGIVDLSAARSSRGGPVGGDL